MLTILGLRKVVYLASKPRLWPGFIYRIEKLITDVLTTSGLIHLLDGNDLEYQIMKLYYTLHKQ